MKITEAIADEMNQYLCKCKQHTGDHLSGMHTNTHTHTHTGKCHVIDQKSGNYAGKILPDKAVNCHHVLGITTKWQQSCSVDGVFLWCVALHYYPIITFAVAKTYITIAIRLQYDVILPVSASPLSPSITCALFHSRLKTFLFHKSYPP